MANKPSRIRWLPRSVLHLPCWTLVQTPEELKSVLKHIKCTPDQWPEPLLPVTPGCDATVHVLDDGQSTCCILALAKNFNARKAPHLALLAHEAEHIVEAFYNDPWNRGIARDEELSARIIQHVVLWAMDELDRRRRCRKR